MSPEFPHLHGREPRPPSRSASRGPVGRKPRPAPAAAVALRASARVRGRSWLLLLAVPFVLDSAQKDAFRLPKALLGETLALLSLFFLAFAWTGPEEWRRARCARRSWRPSDRSWCWRRCSRWPARTSAHVHRGLAGLWIGALAIWGWSVGFRASRAARGARLSSSCRPRSWRRSRSCSFTASISPTASSASRRRRASRSARWPATSAISPPVLVLPALLAQAELASRRRVGARWPAALVLCLYGLVVTQTFSAIAGARRRVGRLLGAPAVAPASGVAVASCAGAVVLLLAAGRAVPRTQPGQDRPDRARRVERRADRPARRLAGGGLDVATSIRSPGSGSAPTAPSSSRQVRAPARGCGLLRRAAERRLRQRPQRAARGGRRDRLAGSGRVPLRRSRCWPGGWRAGGGASARRSPAPPSPGDASAGVESASALAWAGIAALGRPGARQLSVPDRDLALADLPLPRLDPRRAEDEGESGEARRCGFCCRSSWRSPSSPRCDAAPT